MAENQNAADQASTLNDERATRLAKRAALFEAGQNPYPEHSELEDYVADIETKYAELADGEDTEDVVKIAGRVVAKRGQGKIMFIVVRDATAEIQLFCRINDMDEAAWNTLKSLDLGDILGVTGVVVRTQRGQLSVAPKSATLLAKAVRPLPEKFHGLTNTDQRYRQRYVDLIVNPEVRRTFVLRSQIIKSVREILDGRDFLEVETPIMHSIAGGAAARPFITYHNALDMQLYMRIAPELFLKRCLVGGIDRVFEINRDFRNEGVDATHAPEFTMVEAYQAYGNYDTIGALVKQLVQDTAMDVFGTHKVTLLDGSEYDFGGEWKTISMYDSLSEALGEEIVPNGGPDNPGTSVEHLGAIADKLGVERDDVENHGKLVEHLWEHFYEDKLFEPTFVRDFPVETSPLVKGHRSKPGVVEKWDLYVRGFELATGYSELNDPVVQRERFVAQAKDALAGDEEACDIDEDFLEALGVGMPPAGGMGMGIDRLLIALTGATIRETITFPLVKPLN